MLLFDFKNAWEDYKYYVVVVAILLVLLLVVTMTCVISSSKKKKNVNNVVTDQETDSKNTGELENTLELDNEEAEENVVAEETKTEENVVAEETKTETAEEDNIVLAKNSETVKEVKEEKPVETVIEEKVETTKPSVEEKETKASAPKKAKATTPKSTAKSTTSKAKTSTVKGKYEIVPDQEGFKYILKASNGESLIVSESYKTILGCKGAIKRLQENSKDAEIQIEQDKKNNFQFHVKRGSRTVAHSANYSTKVSAQNASNSFMKFVNSDRIDVVEATNDIAQPELVDLSNQEISTTTVGKIVISKEDDQFLYRLYANNGQIICMSRPYKTKASIKNSIEKFQEAVYNGKFYMIVDKNGNYQFKLYGANNILLLTGESFTTKDACKSNIESCYRFAKNATIEDISNLV